MSTFGILQWVSMRYFVAAPVLAVALLEHLINDDAYKHRADAWCWQLPLVCFVTMCANALLAIIIRWLHVCTAKSTPEAAGSWGSEKRRFMESLVRFHAHQGVAAATVGTPFANLWLRLLGTKVGRGVFMDTLDLDTPELVSIGDGVRVGKYSCLVQDWFHGCDLSRTVVSHGASIQPSSLVSANARIESRVQISACTAVGKGEIMRRGMIYAGNPARELSDQAAAAARRSTEFTAEVKGAVRLHGYSLLPSPGGSTE